MVTVVVVVVCVCVSVCVISRLCHRIFHNTRKASDFTYYSKRICFKETEQQFFGLINIFVISNGFGFVLGGFCVFVVLIDPAETSDDVRKDTDKACSRKMSASRFRHLNNNNNNNKKPQ